jgi:hypothetical protein
MRYLTALTLTLVGLSSAGAADIYCNNQGRDCSDKPSPGAVMVHIASSNFGSNTLSAPAAGSERAAANRPADGGASARLAQQDRVQAVQKDVSTARATQCKEAQTKYQQSVEARRVYRMGKDGEREYLSDTEAEQMRLNARLEMEQSCGKSSS